VCTLLKSLFFAIHRFIENIQWKGEAWFFYAWQDIKNVFVDLLQSKIFVLVLGNQIIDLKDFSLNICWVEW